MPASVTTGPARSNNVSSAKVWTYRGSLQGSRKLWILCGGAQHQRVPGTGKTRLQPESQLFQKLPFMELPMPVQEGRVRNDRRMEEKHATNPQRSRAPMGQHHREINPHQGCHANQKEERQTQSTRRATNKQRSGKSEKGKVSKKVPKNMHEPRTRRHHMKSPPGAGSEHTPRARKPRYSSQ
jgi:hypothetical protein